MNIIVTGPRNIGKTTVISKVLAQLKSRPNYTVSGITTFFRQDKDGGKDVFLSPVSDERKIFFLGSRKNKVNTTCNTHIFDSVGFDLLSVEADLFVIDEIGNLEKQARKYLDKIEELLRDTDKNVLLVVQQDICSEVNRIMRIPHIRFDITGDNRDTAAEEILHLLQ